MKTFKRYLCGCETWMACAYEAEKGCLGVEYGSERNQIFHYVFKGSARVGKLFSGDSKVIDEGGITIEDDFTYLQGPNYSLNIRQETATSGEGFSFSTLLESNVTSSINLIKNLLNEKEINININYENYGYFVHFS